MTKTSVRSLRSLQKVVVRFSGETPCGLLREVLPALDELMRKEPFLVEPVVDTNSASGVINEQKSPLIIDIQTDDLLSRRLVDSLKQQITDMVTKRADKIGVSVLFSIRITN